MIKRYLFFSLLVGVLYNCALFREGLQAPKSGTIEVTKPASKTLSINVSGIVVENGGNPQSMQSMFLKPWQDVSLEEGKASSLFTSVVSGEPKSDFILDLEVREDSSANIALALVTGLTLYLFPSSASAEITLKGTFKKAGKEVGTVIRKEKVTFWQQILLIFVLPFKFPGNVMNDIRHDMVFDIYKEANQKAFFK